MSVPAQRRRSSGDNDRSDGGVILAGVERLIGSVISPLIALRFSSRSS